SKMLMPGTNRRHTLKNNWVFWGSKGLMTTHLGFEFGVATTISTARFDYTEIDEDEIRILQEKGYEHVFRMFLRDVADMKMYEEYSAKGWTRHLAKETRDVLVPDIVKAVTLSWLAAVQTVDKK